MNVTHGGDVWQGRDPGEYLDFSANLNPDGPPDWVLAALETGLANARWYPDVRSRAALEGMSWHLGIPEDCLLLTAGGIDAVKLAAGLSRSHVVAQPAFQEYARLCGCHRDVPREEILSAEIGSEECLWLCNPNNPTGDAISREWMLELLERVDAVHGRLVADEAFVDYCPQCSVLDAVQDHPALIVLGSLTKSLAIPGVRLGYLAAHPSVIRMLSGGLPPWRLNCLAEAVAAAMPGHEADFERIRRLNDRRREVLAAELRSLGARVIPSRANFLLCEFGRDMRPVAGALARQGILIRLCGMFPGLSHGHVRLCVRTEAENRRLVEALAEIMQTADPDM